jgi:hypothetical protein
MIRVAMDPKQNMVAITDGNDAYITQANSPTTVRFATPTVRSGPCTVLFEIGAGDS